MYLRVWRVWMLCGLGVWRFIIIIIIIIIIILLPVVSFVRPAVFVESFHPADHVSKGQPKHKTFVSRN